MCFYFFYFPPFPCYRLSAPILMLLLYISLRVACHPERLTMEPFMFRVHVLRACPPMCVRLFSVLFTGMIYKYSNLSLLASLCLLLQLFMSYLNILPSFTLGITASHYQMLSIEESIFPIL